MGKVLSARTAPFSGSARSAQTTTFGKVAKASQLLTSNKSVPNVTSYVARTSEAQLLTSNKSVPCVTTYATRASKGSAPYGQTGPFLRHFVCQQGHQRLSSPCSNKSANAMLPTVKQVRSLQSLRMSQGHQRLSSLRSNNAHAIGIGIHCDMHGRILRGANAKMRFVPKPLLHAPLVSLTLGNRYAIS